MCMCVSAWRVRQYLDAFVELLAKSHHLDEACSVFGWLSDFRFYACVGVSVRGEDIGRSVRFVYFGK